jgi:hypothetical protein
LVKNQALFSVSVFGFQQSSIRCILIQNELEAMQEAYRAKEHQTQEQNRGQVHGFASVIPDPRQAEYQ